MPKYASAVYVPTKGFFDLSVKPKGMTKTLHKKVQGLQMLLITEAQKYRNSKIREENKFLFRDLQEHFAELQQIILQYWPEEMLFKEV